MQCDRCGYGKDAAGVIHHAVGCPEAGGDFAAYLKGRTDGRQGKNPVSQHPSYTLGYKQGQIALEEAVNGYKSWGA